MIISGGKQGSYQQLSEHSAVFGQHEQWVSPTLIKETLLVFQTYQFTDLGVFAWLTGWHKGEKGTECREVRRNFLSCCCCFQQKHLARNSDLSHPFPISLSKSDKSGEAASWSLISNLCLSQYEPVQAAWLGFVIARAVRGGGMGGFTDQPVHFWIICGLPLGSVQIIIIKSGCNSLESIPKQ